MHLKNHIGTRIRNPIGGTAQTVGGRNLERRDEYDEIADTMQHVRFTNRARTVGTAGLWRFTRLPYYPGLVTWCGIHDVPVLTGWMSGCYLFRYVKNGRMHAAHVGTHESDDEKSNNAKRVWKTFADRVDVTDIYGVSPLDVVPDSLIQSAYRSATTLKVAGLWEPNGMMRVLIFGSQRGDMQSLELLGVETPALKTWAAVRNTSKFTLV